MRLVPVGVGKDLAQLYAALESPDLAAGSPAARRLFAAARCTKALTLRGQG